MFMNDVGICCDYKRELFIHKNAHLDSLKITPRFVIFEKYKPHRKYKRTILIENDHTYPRNIFIENNFPDELEMASSQQQTLRSGEIMPIDIIFEPSNRKQFEQNCHSVYISSIHPSMTVEIPVFLQPNSNEIWFPLYVKMQDSSPGVHCYYSFPIYNPTGNEATCLIRVNSERTNVRFLPNSCNLPAKGFSVVHLETVGTNMCPVQEELKLLITSAKNRKKQVKNIRVEAKMVSYLLSVSDFVVRFPCTELGSMSSQCILICNEIEEVVKFKWCRREKQEDSPQNEELFEIDHMVRSHVKQINEYFQIEPKSGVYKPISSASALITFCPPTEVSHEALDPPYEFRAFAYLACSTNRNQRVRVELVGCAAGPNIEFVDKTINLGEIVLGELKQTEAFATNLGSVAGTLQFIPNDNYSDGNVNVSPKEVKIDAKEIHKVIITFCAKSEGNFLEKLTFRVMFGNYVSLFLKGAAISLTAKLIQEEIHFGNIPICVLCTKKIEIFNPFKHSTDIVCSVPEDGNEIPLILMIDEENFVEKVSTDERIENLFESSDSSSETELETDYNVHGFESNKFCCGVYALKTLRKQSSMVHSEWEHSEKQRVIDEEETTSCSRSESNGTSTSRTVLSREWTSSEYYEVLERIPSMASEIVSNLKIYQYEENDKVQEFIIDSTIKNLFKLDYFKRMVEGINFRKKSWRELPSNPREFILNTDVVVLAPMETFVLLVPLVANVHGQRKKNLRLDIVPHKTEDSNEDTKVTSNSLSTIVPITYNCVIPTILLSESVFNFTVYLDCSHYFSFEVKNLDSVGGFFALKTDPFDKNVQINMKPKKFYIKAYSWQKIYGKITISKIGNIVSSVIIHALGSKKPDMVRIFAQVLGPELKVNPKSITVIQTTLEKKETQLYLSNDSPARAKFVVKMAVENFTFVEPKEGVLDEGQNLIIIITSLFYDPGEYLNTLHIMESSNSTTSILKVPLKFKVQGFPFEFSSNVRNGLDLNIIAISEKIHKTELTIINHGDNNYNLIIQKTKKSSNLSSGFEIEPKTLSFQPKEKKTAMISIKSLNTGVINEEFSVKASKRQSTKRIHMFNFECKVEFVRILLKWCSNQLNFNIKNSDMDDGFKSSEKAMLTNCSKITSEVSLSTVGPFIVFDIETNEYGNRFNFLLESKKSKQFEIFFDMKFETYKKISAIYEGKIITKTEKMIQKGLMLTAKMIYPNLEIDEHELQFFTRNQQFYAFFTICNPGILPAVYKWQLRKEIKHSIDIYQGKAIHEQKTLSQEIFSKKCLLIFNDPFENERMTTIDKVLNVLNNSEAKYTVNVDDEQNTKYLQSAKTNKKVNKKNNFGSVKKKERESKDSRVNKMLSIQDLKNLKGTEIEVNAHQSVSRASLFVTSDDLSQEIDNITVKKSFENDFEVLAPTKYVEESSTIPKHFYLNHYKGHISPETSRVMNVFFSGNSRNSLYKANYDLEVAGGNSVSIEFNVYNFDATVKLSKSKFKFGSQPWYELHDHKIKLCNKNSFTVKINILENRFLQKDDELLKGFVCVNPNGKFFMLDESTCYLNVKVYLGLCNIFCDGFGIEINNNIPLPVIFEGNPAIPMLTVLDVERPNLGSFNRELEYLTLNKLFLENVKYLNYPQPKIDEEQFDIEPRIELSHDNEYFFKEDLQEDESQNEVDKRRDLLTQFIQLKDLAIVENGSVRRRRYDKKYEKIGSNIEETDDFVVLDYPEDYPPALYIEKMIETANFIDLVNVNSTVDNLFRELISKFVLTANKTKLPRSSKKFTPAEMQSFDVHPLPFHVSLYYLDFGFVQMEKEMSLELELFFHGPGRAMFSTRTTTYIPGLTAEFLAPQIEFSKNQFHISNIEPVANPGMKYRNIKDRELCNGERSVNGSICKEMDNSISKYSRAHSYDLDSNNIHTREKISRKIVQDHYNKLSLRLKDKKDQFVLSEFYQADCSSSTDMMLGMRIKFHPNSEFYEDGILFEDFLLIDIHMGPTVPVLMRGVIRKEENI